MTIALAIPLQTAACSGCAGRSKCRERVGASAQPHHIRLLIMVSGRQALNLPELSEGFPLLPVSHLAVGLLLHRLLEFIHEQISFPAPVASLRPSQRGWGGKECVLDVAGVYMRSVFASMLSVSTSGLLNNNVPVEADANAWNCQTGHNHWSKKPC